MFDKLLGPQWDDFTENRPKPNLKKALQEIKANRNRTGPSKWLPVLQNDPFWARKLNQSENNDD